MLQSVVSKFADVPSGERPAAPLVIPALPNRDWRESSRRTPSFRPEARQDQGDIDSTPDRIGDGAQHSGLRFAVKTETKQEEETKDGIQVKLETTETSATVVNGSGSASASTTVVKKEPLTLEEQALQAILAGDQERESEEARARRELVIQMQENRSMGTPMSEEAALRRDMASLPEEVGPRRPFLIALPLEATRGGMTDGTQSTMEDFEAVPISAFGIAALRGMGWDPKSADNVKAREVHRRPQLLGLGATPLDTTIKPTHKGNDKSKPKDKKKSHAERTGRGFSAASLLVRRDRDSGSVTPAEGSSRRTSPGTTGTDSDASRVRRREDDEASYDSGREGKRREGDGYRERDRERDRERERDRYGDWERDRYRERETEEERARRKAKEREREKERYPNGDRDRSRYDERDRDRDRERQRERDGWKG